MLGRSLHGYASQSFCSDSILVFSSRIRLLGDRRDLGNPMQWDRLCLNLPRDTLFDASLPLVMKWNDLVNRIAGDVESFVDDLHTSGHSVENVFNSAAK